MLKEGVEIFLFFGTGEKCNYLFDLEFIFKLYSSFEEPFPIKITKF